MPITVIVPDQCLSKENESTLLLLRNPRTGDPKRYLHVCDELYELTAVDGTNPHTTDESELSSTRSLLFSSNRVVRDATVVVATPLDPLFLVLPTLHRYQNKFLTADYIQDIIDSDNADIDSVPVAVFEKSLRKACDVRADDGDDSGASYRLNIEKLFAYLNKLRDDVVGQNALPRGLYVKLVEDPVRPADSAIPVDATMLESLHKKVAMELLCSYLSKELSEMYLKTQNFTELEEHMDKISTDKRKMMEVQNQLLNAGTTEAKKSKSAPLPTKKGPGLSRGAKSLQKANVTGNRSLMDMFSRKTVS
jgi:hypothetical protein